MRRTTITGLAAFGLFLALFPVACHKEEQAVVGVAKNAVNAEQQAQAAAQAQADDRDRQRTALALIPLPSKSLYIDVHDPEVWANPFLSVSASGLTLRTHLPEAAPASVKANSAKTNGKKHSRLSHKQRKAEAQRLAAQRIEAQRNQTPHRQETQLRLDELAKALVTLPPSAWRYGRVIAIAESPMASPQDRPKLRRNLEAAIQQLNDLGLVVEEWPTK
jgi:type II secretory pathway pseudopilin PulG